MAGIDGFATKFYRMSGTNSTAVSGITNISGPGMEGVDIDVSDMDSTDGFREYIPGIVDAGQVDLQMNYLKAEASTLHGLWRTTGTYRIVFSDASYFAFNGYLKSLGPEAPFDNKVSQSSAWKLSGKPTFATGA